MAEKYIVEVELKYLNLGDAEAKANRLGGSFNHLAKTIQSIGSTGGGIFGALTGVLDSVASRIWDVTKAVGTAGLGAAFAGATYGVMSLNKELESTKLSLATIFTVQNQTANIDQGLGLAASTIKEMRKDAAQLPGEFKDLLNIFTTGATSAFRAGSNPEQFRKLSAQAMAAAQVLKVPMDQAAREFSALLEGRSGAQNTFGLKSMGLAGDSAEKFNKMAPEKRFAMVAQELGKYQGAIALFSSSMEGASSTLLDNAKEFLRASTEPLFNKVKDTFISVNKWFEANQDKVQYWSMSIGTYLANAFDWGKKKIEEWGPPLMTFAQNAWAKLKEIWVQIKPAAESFASAMKEALKDPGTIDKLITLAKLYVAAKVAGGGLEMAAGLAGTGLNIANTAALVKGAGGGAGAAGGAAAGGGMLAGLGTAAATAGAALLALAGVGLAVWQGWELAKDLGKNKKQDEDAWRLSARKQIAEYDRMSQMYKEGAERTAAVTELAAMDIKNLSLAGNDTRAAMYEVELAAYQAADGLRAVANKGFNINRDAQAAGIADFGMGIATSATTNMAKDFLNGKGEFAKNAKGPKHGGGGGGTSIQKVEIVVTSNQNPSRVARMVFDELGKVSRTRGSSNFVSNYGSLGKV